MALEMKSVCEACRRGIEHSDTAYICSYECTYCPTCRAKLRDCPNCRGELILRPRRPTQATATPLALDQQPSIPQTRRELTPYHPRRTRMVSNHVCCGWRLKIYEICFGSQSIPPDQIEQTLTFVDLNTPWPLTTGSHHQAGFVIIHRGREAIWLMVHLWQADILIQFAYQATLLNPIDFSPLRADGFCGCVWELEVVRHERDAWVECAMGSDDASIDAYFNNNLFLDSESQ